MLWSLADRGCTAQGDGVFLPELRKWRSPPGTTNSIPKLDSRNRLAALASMLELIVSSRTAIL
jgi:hypothetical protein